MPIVPDIPAAEAAIIAMTNTFREEHKLSAVEPNPQLTTAARDYAKVLAAHKGELSHSADGSSPETRAATAGYGTCEIAENLVMLDSSRGFTAAEYARRAMQGWEESPGHRENLLLPHVTETGVAIARTGADATRYVAVQLLGRPMSLSYTFQVANRAQRPVTYTFAGEPYLVRPRQAITHTSCMQGTIAFSLNGKGTAQARYEARSGKVYTLKPDAGGGLKVEVGGSAKGN